jgi:hypothetical protein
LLAALAGASGAAAAAGDDGARVWILQVRDTPPDGRASFARGADRSYSVSTGGAGERDDSGAAGNGYAIGAGNIQRQMRVREGERLRVDLPAVQSLQFHVPPGPPSAAGAGAGAARAAAATGRAPSTGAAPPAANAPGTGPGASAVVYFDSVAAFAASLHVSGTRVHIDLVPLRVGGVEAPLIGGANPNKAPVAAEGRLGEWIALGDAELPPVRSLSPTPEPPSPASVWVRVLPDSESGDDAPAVRPGDNSQVVGTGRR